jgi:hypothetical protein
MQVEIVKGAESTEIGNKQGHWTHLMSSQRQRARLMKWSM